MLMVRFWDILQLEVKGFGRLTHQCSVNAKGVVERIKVDNSLPLISTLVSFAQTLRAISSEAP